MSGGLWEREDVGWGGSPTARAPWDVQGSGSESPHRRMGRKEGEERGEEEGEDDVYTRCLY